MTSEGLDDEFILEEEAEASPAAIKKLRERLKAALQEKREYLEGWQRSRADYLNLKRDEEVRCMFERERIKVSLLEDLIPILDSFELAQAHAKNKELQVLYKQLLSAIQKIGVERFGKVGEQFDPHRHEALREEEVDTVEKDHTVVTLERSGYSIGEHVVRPAHVSVGVYKK